MRRNAIGQTQKRAKPVQFVLAELLTLHPIVCTADDRADGNDDHIQQLVLLAALDARIDHLPKMLADAAAGRFTHGDPLGLCWDSPQSTPILTQSPWCF